MKKENYGWIICITCALLLFCTSGLATTGFSVYQPYLISMRGLTNTQSSTVTLFRSLFALAGMLVSNILIKKFEVRKVVSVCMLICAGSFAAYAYADSFAGCCMAASLAGIAFGCGGMIPASILIARWFEEHRGLALGICMASTGLSATIASPIISKLVETFSLQMAFQIEAVFVFVAAIIVYSVLRSNPSCLHTVPVGSHAADGHIHVSHNYASQSAPVGLFGIVAAGIMIFGMPANNLNTHLSVLYQSVNVGSEQIASMISVFGLAMAIGKCVYGQIADKIGTYKASWIFFCFVLAGSACCCMADNGDGRIAMAGIIMMGFGLAITTVSISMYAAALSTEAEFSRNVTVFQLLSTGGSLAFAAVPGVIADMCGNYIPAFKIMFVLAAVSALMMQTGYHLITTDNEHVKKYILKRKFQINLF